MFDYDARSCYQLLSQGPCGEAEWLVLDTESQAARVVCRPRVCPCAPAMPELCEVRILVSMITLPETVSHILSKNLCMNVN